MKKLVLLSVLLLVLAVSVSAAYTTVPASVMKTTTPTVAPVSVRTAVPPTVQVDCQTMCKRVISQGMGVFIRCMHDRCKEDCESSCREMFGSQSQDCIVKFCMPQLAPKETCEQGCGRKLDECLKTTVGINIESIRAACTKLHNECMQEQCGQPPETCEQSCDKNYKVCLEKTVGLNMESVRAACERLRNECVQEKCEKPEQPPQTCEQGCDRKRDECLKTAVGMNIEGIKAGCEKLHGECMREKCKPECPTCPGCPPPHECEDKCAKGYYTCAKIARTMTSQAGKPEDVQEEYLRRCRLGVSECLDECLPELPPEYSCPERCRMVEKECLDAGIDKESCGMKVNDCMKMCGPQPMMGRPDCPTLCSRRHKECLGSDINPEKCDAGLKNCMNLCVPKPGVFEEGVSARVPSPEEMEGLNPQPEPPSWFRRFLGWFGG